MNKKNFVLTLFALLLGLTLFPVGVQALTYRYDVDNGSWSGYYKNINSIYYQDFATGQTTYNRDFETAFSITNLYECEAGWCLRDGDGNALRSSAQAYEGTYSMNVIATNAHPKVVAESEFIGDSNVAWFVKGTVNADSNFGYIDSNNVFTSAGNYSAGVYANWTKVSFKVPQGNYRLVIFWSISNENTDAYFDNIQVQRLNSGTFRTTDPQYCTSIASCNNIKYHLPSSEYGVLYYTADFVSGGTCSYRLNKPLSDFALSGGAFTADGTLTEGSGGMYYLAVTSSVDTNQYKDLNIEAYCVKGATTKGFFTQPKVYSYGNITGGNVEEDPIRFVPFVGGDGTYERSNTEAQDGNHSLRVYTPGGHPRLTNRAFNIGGSTVSFWIKGTIGSTARYGYATDANVFTDVGGFATYYPDWKNFTFTVPSGTYYFDLNQAENHTGAYYLDNFTSSGAKQTSTLVASNNLSANYGLRGTDYNFYSSFKNAGGNSISTATCTLKIGSTYYPMVYNAVTGLYTVAHTFVSNGEYSIAHGCTQTSYNDGNSSYAVNIVTPASQIITFTPISNVSGYSLSNFSQDIDFTVTSSNSDIIFSVVAQEDNYSPKFVWKDYSTGLEQYAVYVSSDGASWTYSESITFGDSSAYNNPVQKIWNDNYFEFSFSNALASGTKKYFKLRRITPPIAWRVIKGSGDWVNVNDPSSFVDLNGHSWDLFHDSSYTNIKSYTVKSYPQLTGADFNVGFEVQFTAFASNDSNIQVGYLKQDGTSGVVDIRVTTDKQRFSVPVALIDWNSSILIKSVSTSSERIYITDYAIIPKSYFTSRLEIFNFDGSELTSLIRSASSYEYLKEGVPFMVKTSAYDLDNDLDRLRIEALVNNVVVKSYEYDLTAGTLFNTYNWSSVVEGVIDLNGTASINGVLEPLRDFTVRAVLVNKTDQNVAEQFKTIKLLQYPYFTTDLIFNAYSINRKVGSNPKFSIYLSQLAPEAFIGIEVAIYDENHTVGNPNFVTTVYPDDLACGTLFNCAKTLTFDGYAFEQETGYTATFTILLKTENKSYTNYLTTRNIDVYATLASLETARVFQVFERRDRQYTNSEEIPLVFQVRDDGCSNLQNALSPYLNIIVGGVAQTTKFFPETFVYDELSCYNYWYWNRIFYLDDGSLVSDNNTLAFKVLNIAPASSHSTSSTGYALASKCSGYHSDFFNGSFIMDLLGFVGDSTFGCTDTTEKVVLVGSADANSLDINNSYSPSALQNQSILCYRNDVNNEFKQALGDEFVCAVWFLKSEQQIDKFKVIIGNEYSDYAKVGNDVQFMSFDIPAEQIIFSDILLLRQSLATGFETDRINTFGGLLSAGFNKLLPAGQSFIDFGQQQLNSGFWLQNIGADININEQLNPNKVSGLFFFKVKGLQVINQYDYLASYPDLETINPKNFRSYMNYKLVPLPKKEALVYMYNNSFEAIPFKVSSPLIIFEQPSEPSKYGDANTVNSVVPTTLKFNFIVDMFSNNMQSVQRAYVPIMFSYIVPDNCGLACVGKFVADFAENPQKAIFAVIEKNWFIVIMLIIFALIVAVIYSFLKGGSNINIYGNNGRR